MKVGDVVGLVGFVAYLSIESSSITILYAPQIFYKKSYGNIEKTRKCAVFDVAPFGMLGCVSGGVKPRSLLCGRECAPEGDKGTLKERKIKKVNGKEKNVEN